MECNRHGFNAMAILIVSVCTAAPVTNRHRGVQLDREAVSATRVLFVRSAELPPEYRFIRPADFDDTPPPIPPSETWPAHFR